MRRTKLASVGLLALATLAAACSESQGEAPAPGAEGIPSREQARQRAADDIDAENADEELERLRREIDGDA